VQDSWLRGRLNAAEIEQLPLVRAALPRYIPPMTEPEKAGSKEARRKRLFFRAQRRGFKEVDLIFGAFAEAHLAGLSEAELDDFEALLEAPDQEVYAWLRGHAPVPPSYDNTVFARLQGICQRKAPTWNV
jgi:antitoxin CptB